MASRTGRWVHFVHCHVRSMVVILEEGNRPHSCCPRCDMLVPWVALNVRHLNMAMCVKGAERKRRRLAAEEARAGTETDFRSYGCPLNNVRRSSTLTASAQLRTTTSMLIPTAGHPSNSIYEAMLSTYISVGVTGVLRMYTILQCVVQVPWPPPHSYGRQLVC